MERVKHGTATGNSRKRYASPRARVVFIKAQGVLCLSDPSLNDWGNGSSSNGGDMDMEEN